MRIIGHAPRAIHRLFNVGAQQAMLEMVIQQFDTTITVDERAVGPPTQA